MEKQLVKELEQQMKELFITGLLNGEPGDYFKLFTDHLVKFLHKTLSADLIVCYVNDPWKRQLHVFSYYQKTHIPFPQSIPQESLQNQMSTVIHPNCIAQDGRGYTHLPLQMEEIVGGLLLIVGSDHPNLSIMQDTGELIAGLMKKAWELDLRNREEKRYKLLQKITAQFHSSMSVQAVLKEVITSLESIFPDFTYSLLLAQDHHRGSGLPIKELDLEGENLSVLQAYVSGTVQFEDTLKSRNSVLYAPLLGKQGVYGILEVTAHDSVIFPANEIEFISLLANTAGSAIENAQLYEQSKRLIADLTFINETSHKLNSNLRLSETTRYVRDQMNKSFEAEEIGFFLLDGEETPTLLSGSTAYFQKSESNLCVDYVISAVKKEIESLFIGDLNLPGSGKETQEYRSLMAVPMVQDAKIKGLCIVLHSSPYHFTFEMFKLMQSLLHHSSLAFANSMLREELEKMVKTDYLTGLYSRNHLEEKMNEFLFEEAEGTFILLDIDNFKHINDVFGHQIGDEILIQVASIIKGSIRETDIGSRWGGEELAIFLPNVGMDVACQIAGRLVEKVKEGTKPQVTISCGLASRKKCGQENMKHLFKRADEALYKAKRLGKNRVVIDQ